MKNDLELLEKYTTTQEREWIALRLFWIFMGLVLTAAAFGLFGNGILSEKTYSTDNLHVNYNRFLRVEKETELQIQVKDLGRNAAIGINNDYLKKVRITQVIPEPASVAINNNTLVYKFSPVNNGVITFILSPQIMGSQKLEISISGKKMGFEQYIYF